jgi:hypothetical protein
VPWAIRMYRKSPMPVVEPSLDVSQLPTVSF